MSIFATMLEQAAMDDRPAIRDAAATVSFRELAARARALASRLREAGVAPGDSVVWEAPPESSHVDATVLLAAGLNEATFVSWPRGTDQTQLARQLPVAAFVSTTGGRVEVRSVARGPVDAAGFDYVLGTSGSTAAPKLVGITAANLTPLVEHLASAPRVRPGWNLAQVYHSYFDPYYSNLIQCLVTRCCLVHVPPARLLRLGATLRDYDIQALDCVPSTIRHAMRLRQLKPADLKGLRLVVLGGEILPTEVALSLIDTAPSATVVNAYGPTEATITATEFECGDGWTSAEQSVPIGRPLPGIQLGLAEHDGEHELVLFGPQVIEGYVDPSLNQRHFAEVAEIELVHGPVLGDQGFRTGDRVRVVSDQLYVDGRFDDQVKVQGRRVDLAEVLRVVRAGLGGGEAWVGFVDAHVVAVVEGAEIADHALAGLREYARPDRTISVDRLPRRGAGKLDVAAIRQLAASAGSREAAAHRGQEIG